MSNAYNLNHGGSRDESYLVLQMKVKIIDLFLRVEIGLCPLMAAINCVDIKMPLSPYAFMEDWILTVAEFNFSKYGPQTATPKSLVVII